MALAFLAPVYATIDRVAMPRMDEVFMKVISDPDAATTAFQNAETDFYPDMIRTANIEKLQNESHTILPMAGFHMCYLGLNTRDYVPDDAGQPDAGKALAPMNWTNFRQGLAWAGLSNAEKADAILEIYEGPVNVPLGTVIPPALGVWHDPTVPTPGCNFTKAWEDMEASGFYIVGDLLYQPNDVVVRDEIEVESPSEAPTSVAFTQKFVDKWNLFFDTYLGITNCNILHTIEPFGTEVQNAFIYRNFDAYFLCWGLGRFPDYLYDFFHSSMEGIDNYNTPGMDDPELDALLEILKFGLVYPEKIAACHLAQYKIVVELVPYVCIYSRTYYTAFANRGGGHYLTNMVNQGGYGADNFWTWTLFHWADIPVGGTVAYTLGAHLDDLHPGTASSAYEWDVLGLALDALIAVTPDLGDLPWIAGSWTVESFDWAPLNIYDGTKVTFQLREGVKWHDGEDVTVDDVAFAWEFMKNFGRYTAIWQDFAWSEIVDPCTIIAYMNVTSQWILYDLAGLALYFPEHIYSHPPVAGPYAGTPPEDAPVWEIPYEDWQGYAPPAIPLMVEGMKAVVGCGPYVFDYYDPTTEIVHMVKYPDYWVDIAIWQNFITEKQRYDPGEEIEYYVELVNGGTKVAGVLQEVFIDFVELTVDGAVVDVIPGPIVIDPFDTSGLIGPFYHTFVTKGEHYLDCHTYEEGTLVDEYIFPIYVTIEADLNYDYVVDIFDIVIVGLAFGSVPGDANWNEAADINGDFVVDIFDIVIVALNFGWV
jgi:peptide/nickel transport system substrate-binding protein